MIILLAVPTILEQLLSTLLQYVDTAMVGRLGENATAAVSVTTIITWLMGSIASALSYVAGGIIMYTAFRKNKHFNWKINTFVLYLH